MSPSISPNASPRLTSILFHLIASFSRRLNALAARLPSNATRGRRSGAVCQSQRLSFPIACSSRLAPSSSPQRRLVVSSFRRCRTLRTVASPLPHISGLRPCQPLYRTQQTLSTLNQIALVHPFDGRLVGCLALSTRRRLRHASRQRICTCCRGPSLAVCGVSREIHWSSRTARSGKENSCPARFAVGVPLPLSPAGFSALSSTRSVKPISIED